MTGEAPQLQTATTEMGSNFAPKLFTDAPIYAGGLRNVETFVNYQAGVVYGLVRRRHFWWCPPLQGDLG